MHSTHAVERSIPLSSDGEDKDDDDPTTELAPPPLHAPLTFGSEPQAVSTEPASRSDGGMTKQKATRLHL